MWIAAPSADVPDRVSIAHCLVAVARSLWAAAPFVTDQLFGPARFIVLLGLLAFISGSVVSLSVSVLEIYTSASLIQEIAQLLNLRTAEEALVLGRHAARAKERQVGPTSIAEAAKAEREHFNASSKAIEWHCPSYDFPPTILPWVHEASAPVPIFRRTRIFDLTAGPPAKGQPVEIDTIPGGKLIRVRVDEASDSGVFSDCAEFVLMQMLAGGVHAHVGSVECRPMLRTEILLPGIHVLSDQLTLLANLLFGTVDQSSFWSKEGQITLPAHLTEEKLWTLCHYCGVSASVIGEQFKEAWSVAELSSMLPWISDANLSKLALARILLRKPDVLLVHGFADGLSPADQARLVVVLKEYLKTGALPWEVPAEAATSSERTILISYRDPNFDESIFADLDLELTLVSHEHASLRLPLRDPITKATIRAHADISA